MRFIDKLAYREAEKFTMTLLRVKRLEPEIYEVLVDFGDVKAMTKEDISNGLDMMRKDRDLGKAFDFCGENWITWFWHVFWANKIFTDAVIETYMFKRNCRWNDEA